MSLLLVNPDRSPVGFVELSRDQAGYLASLVRADQLRSGRKGEEPATDLDDLLAIAMEFYGGTSRQTKTDQDESRTVDQGRPYVGRDDDDALLTQAAAARELGCTPRTVCRMLERGDLAPTYSGSVRRIARRELDRYLSGAKR